MNESAFDLSTKQSKSVVPGRKKVLTIVIVCDVLGQENNGTTIAAMHLIRALRNKGHHVRVVCSDIFRVGEQDYYIVPQLSTSFHNVGITYSLSLAVFLLNFLRYA